MTQRRVVITGVGPVTPIGSGATEFWNALLESRCGIDTFRSFDPGRFASRVGGEIADLSVADAVPKSYRKAAKIMARDIVLAVVAARHAALDAGLRTKCLIERGDVQGGPNVDSTRFGANIGAGLICADLPELAQALHSAAENGEFSLARWGTIGMNNLTPLWLLKFLPNMLACHVTIVHDAQGPSNTITCSEASAHLAIGEAFRTIARGVADVCICGGAESLTNPMAHLRQELAGRLTSRNDNPAQSVRPFAADRDGTADSEGGGLVILEDLDHARQRGARIYAELVGFGASNDAFDPRQPSRPHPEGRGVALAIRKALADAKVSPEQVSAIGTYACGLLAHDESEAAGIRAALGPRAAEAPVINVKAGLGNNGAGSGAIDFIATVLSTHNATIPPACNSKPLDAKTGLRLVTETPIDARIENALSIAYALNGGQNAALVVRRYRE